jgi:hypothetical protein
MRPHFRIKSRSLPSMPAKIYSKIQSNPSHEQWRLFLQKEIELAPTIRELSRGEFDISSQHHNKFSVRQNYQIKKEIIAHL